MDYKVLNQELIDYLMELDKFFEDEDIRPIIHLKMKILDQ